MTETVSHDAYLIFCTQAFNTVFLPHTYYVETVERKPIQMSTLHMQNHKLHLLLVYIQFASFHIHAVSIHITEAKYLWNKTLSTVRRWKQKQATKEGVRKLCLGM